MLAQSQPIPTLDALREIALPDPVSYAPQTVGWWIVFGVLAVGLGEMALAACLRWWSRRHRRAALASLDDLMGRLVGPGRIGALREIPAVVKRVALVSFGRENTAPMAGPDWLAFLDETYGGTGFREGAGKLLTAISYGPQEQLGAISDDDATDLVAVVRQWVQAHRVKTKGGSGDA
jgi:hypothetical protein